eukprot:Hpha_TRINITY_DN15753_c4_g4::TRINITY_DN15753_c4_g4_i1::g.39258::m.39258
MEFLSEMSGDDERLRKLNEAQLKPEDQMQTDEWMYELREKELQKRKELEEAGGEAAEEDPSNEIRLTSDAEEIAELRRRSSRLGAADMCQPMGSVTKALEVENKVDVLKEGSRASLTGVPVLPPRVPPVPLPPPQDSGQRAGQPPVTPVGETAPGPASESTANTGKEPPPPDILPVMIPGTVPAVGSNVNSDNMANTGHWTSPSIPVSSPLDEASPDEDGSPRMPDADKVSHRYLVDDLADSAATKILKEMNTKRQLLRMGFHLSLALAGVFVVLASAAVMLHVFGSDGDEWELALVAVSVIQLCLLIGVWTARKRQSNLWAQDQNLLHSFLPSDVIAQMHMGVRTIAVKHESLTFAFCDLVGFTKASSKLPPAMLVAGLNKLITAFDEQAVKMKITKVKTMGDAYMAVAGFRDPDVDHILQMAQWCMRMIRLFRNFEVSELQITSVSVRMGLATGPAVSGIIGITKPVYDFWGDTVNMASRMESNSVKNRINCTLQVKDHLWQQCGFTFDTQFDIFVKGKGRMNTYLLIDPKEQKRQRKEKLRAAAWEKENEKAADAQEFQSEIDQLAGIQSEKAFHDDIRQVLTAVSALTEELELQKATALVVRTVRELLRCDRATLFMVDNEHQQLWSFHNLDDKGRRIRMPLNKGVAGWAATKAEIVNISDAYDDPRFNKQVDIITGYRTRNLLCYPVRRGNQVIAVIQAINKKHGKFNEEDTLMIALLGRQAGIHLMHGTMYEQLRQSEMRAYILFQVSRDLNTKLKPADIFESVTNGARRFMQCDRATLFIAEHSRRELFSLKTDSAQEFDVVSVPFSQGICGHVAVTGLATNIPDASQVPFFDPSHDQRTGYRTKSVLCVPIIDSTQESKFETGYCLGVLECINKYQEHDITQDVSGRTDEPIPFSKEDEEYLLSFASFVAVTIRNVMLNDQNTKQKEHSKCLLTISVAAALARSYSDLVLHLQEEIPKVVGCQGCQIFVQTSRKVINVWTQSGQSEVTLGEGDLASNHGIVGRVVMGQMPKFNSVDIPHATVEDPNFNPVIDIPHATVEDPNFNPVID